MEKKIKTPIWLSTVSVVVVIILFSLVLNRAQEREMVTQFNRQQMALAKGVATGLEDLFAGIERSIIIHSRFKKLTGEHGLQIIFRDLEGKVQFVAEGNRAGEIESSFPESYFKALGRPNVTLTHLIEEARRDGTTSVDNFILPDGKGTRPSRLIALVVPQFDSHKNDQGFLLAALSLSSIVKKYLQPANYVISGDAWVVDDHGNILYHPHEEWVGQSSEILERDPRDGKSLKMKMARGEEGFGVYHLVKEGNGTEKNIVAYAPITLGSHKWSVAVSTPYAVAIAQLNKTFFIIMMESFVLIATVLIGGMVMVYSRTKRIRLEEELKYLRERESLQDELAREKKTIEGIIEGSPIPTFVINREHKVIFWNRAFTELSGYDGKEMIGTDKQYLPFYPEKRPVIADLIVDDDIEGLEKYYGKKRVQKSSVVEGAYEADDFYDNLGGRERHLYFLAAPIYDENGEIIAAIETLQDVTREKRLEIDLKEYAKTVENELEKNIRLRKTIEGIIEGSPIPTFVINREHKVIFWNRAFTELSGYDGKEMIGTDKQYLPFYPEKRPVIADLIVDDDIEGLEKYYGKKRVQKSSVVEGAYEADDFYDNLGGRERHLYFLAAPIYDENGEIIAAIETLQDVTREKRLEIDLKEYAETVENELYENIKLRTEIEELYNFLQSIMDSSPDRVFALNSEGIVTYVSRESAKESEFGGKQKMKGRHFTELVPPEQKAWIEEKWGEVKKGNYSPYEIEGRGRDDSKRNLLITPRPIRGTDRFVFVQRDITEFKELEKKFYESQKLAAVGQLSAGIAHEVRNPLSSIKMSLQILEKRLSPTGNDLKRFKIAEKEVEHLEQLVRDILIFAKPMEPDRKPGDVNACIESSLAMAEKEILDKKIHIRTRYGQEIPVLDFDQAMLKQALLNLYLNAVDALAEGGTLSISTLAVAQGEETSVIIRIEDDGSGIDPEDLPHLFNPFFTKKNYGTGLGLTQVKKIIDLHQGVIEISSVKGKGTTVAITLPVHAEAGTLKS